jgi:hypothetical protein
MPWKSANASGIGDVAMTDINNGLVWVAGKENGTIWFSKKPETDYAGNQFIEIQGSGFSRVSLASAGATVLWAVGSTAANGMLWQYAYAGDVPEKGTWAQTKISEMIDVAVAPDGTVWLVRKDGSILFTPDQGKTSNQIEASGFSRVAVGPDGVLWAVGGNGTLWNCLYDTKKGSFEKNWVQTPATGMGDVAVGPFGTVWLAGQNGSIWFSTDNGENFTWVDDASAGNASGYGSVAAGSLNSGVDVWGVGSNETLWFKTPDYVPIAPTEYFNIQYDRSLGQSGVDLANGLREIVDPQYRTVSALFGGISAKKLPITLNVMAATGGGLSGEDYVSVFVGTDLDQACYVFVMEIAEVFMRSQPNGGWNPNNSKGEALSRLLAEDAYPKVPHQGYLTASSWLNSENRDQLDYVSANDDTDKNFVSTGCAILFLNYMMFQLGLDLKKIIADTSPLLSDVYKNLTGRTDAFSSFRVLLERYFPTPKPSFTNPVPYYELPTENPFPLRGSPYVHGSDHLKVEP